jgi:hypothetical protein
MADRVTELHPDDAAAAEASDTPRVTTRVADWCKARGGAVRGLAALAMFTLLSILVFALPVIGDLSTRCVGSCLPDTNLYTWAFGWMDYSLANGLDPLFTSYVWAPFGVHLAWVTSLPGPSIVMQPITHAFGGLTSVNMLMIAAPATAAWAMYLVCVRVTKRFWPAIIGGAVFGFSTYINQHMRAQLNLVLVLFVPLAIYLVLRRIDRSLHPLAFVPALALVLAGEFSTSTEIFATMTLFAGLAYVGALMLSPWKLKKRLLSTALWIVAAYGLALAAAYPIIERLQHNAPPDRAVRPPDLNAVDLLSFVVPTTYGRFGGSRFASISERFPALPQNDTGYIGILFVVIAIWFLVQFRRFWWAWFVAGFAFLAANLSLGPVLHVMGDAVTDLPQKSLWKLPLIQHATPDRFPMYLFIALAVMTAAWLAFAPKRFLWARYAVAVVAIAGMSIDLAIEPHYHGTPDIPAFFTDGTYRQYIGPYDVVLGVPDQLGGDMMWQEVTGFDFRLGRAYIGPIHPIGYENAGLGIITTDLSIDQPGENAIRHFITARDVKSIVVADPVPTEIESLLIDVVGTKPIAIDGVHLWIVPPEGPTPNEPNTPDFDPTPNGVGAPAS